MKHDNQKSPLNPTPARGRFITFEGTEGVGKSTQIKNIERYLRERGITVISTREPGGTALGEKIRQLLLTDQMSEMTELLLMFAARAEHISQLIEPALIKGEWILCDRFTESSYAYQGFGRKLPLDKISQLESMVQGSLRPDLTLWFDLSVESGMERILERRNIDRIEQEKLMFFEDVRSGYRALMEARPAQIVSVDASQPVERVTANIVEALQVLLR